MFVSYSWYETICTVLKVVLNACRVHFFRNYSFSVVFECNTSIHFVRCLPFYVYTKQIFLDVYCMIPIHPKYKHNYRCLLCVVPTLMCIYIFFMCRWFVYCGASVTQMVHATAPLYELLP